MTEAAQAARRPMRARTNRGRSIREEGIVENEDDVIKTGGKTLRRRRGNTRSHDPFYVPENMIPPDMSLEWKRLTVHGKAVSQSGSEEEDPSYMIELEDQGWTPCTTDQFPGLVGKNSSAKSIIRKGMILMMRPKEYTAEARAEDKAEARSQLRQGLAKLTKTPEGQMDRKVQALNRSYERPPVEE